MAGHRGPELAWYVMDSPTLSFLDVAGQAFPLSCRASAATAALAFAKFIDKGYHQNSTVAVFVLGEAVHIPLRIHVLGPRHEFLDSESEISRKISCLLTRSTDGYLRHAAMRNIVNSNKPWVIPYVVLLAGEYVIQIARDLERALPQLDRDAYSNFVRENPDLMRLMKAKAVSYWNCYFRKVYSDPGDYPALAFLQQLENWAC